MPDYGVLLGKPKIPSNLTDCQDVWQLARFLGMNYDDLANLIYNKKTKYRTFMIPKKNGGFRVIRSPIKKIKSLQIKIADELSLLYKPRSSAHGFLKGRSIISNAKKHVGKKYILNIDIKDFFESIHHGRVRHLLESSPFNLSKSVSTVVAHIICYKGTLPQGGTSSPIVSNIISFKLDNQLSSLAKENSCTYTRYVDDITFSFTQNKNKLPKDILSLTKTNEVVLGEKLKNVIIQNGFQLNPQKTRVRKYTQRQEVTGIIVNEKINIDRSFIKKTNSMLYAALKYGAPLAESEYFTNYHKGYVRSSWAVVREKFPGEVFLKILKGRINFIKMVRGTNDNIYRKLMYYFLLLVNKPNEDYSKHWIELMFDSTFVIHTDSAQGTGFLAEGLGLITNEHVIHGLTNDNIDGNCFVQHYCDKSKDLHFPNIFASDPDEDLSIITFGYPVVGKKLKINMLFNYAKNQRVYTIGYPNFNVGDQPTAHETRIIGPSKFMNKDRFVIDASLFHGNSGGPVLDENGDVVGVIANGNQRGSAIKVNGQFIPITKVIELYEKTQK